MSFAKKEGEAENIFTALFFCVLSSFGVQVGRI
jgi:hypothetical protein